MLFEDLYVHLVWKNRIGEFLLARKRLFWRSCPFKVTSMIYRKSILKNHLVSNDIPNPRFSDVTILWKSLVWICLSQFTGIDNIFWWWSLICEVANVETTFDGSNNGGNPTGATCTFFIATNFDMIADLVIWFCVLSHWCSESDMTNFMSFWGVTTKDLN